MGIYRTTGKTITPTVAHNIARRCHDLNLTPNDLHERAKIAYSTLARIHNGQNDDISHATAARLCDTLQTTWTALSNDSPGTIVHPDTNTSIPVTAAGYNSLAPAGTANLPIGAVHVSAPSAPSAVPVVHSQLSIVHYPFSPSIPVHPLPNPYNSTLTSGRQTPFLTQLAIALKASSFRPLLMGFFHTITRFLRAAFSPRPLNLLQLQIAADLTQIQYHDGESDPPPYTSYPSHPSYPTNQETPHA